MYVCICVYTYTGYTLRTRKDLQPCPQREQKPFFMFDFCSLMESMLHYSIVLTSIEDQLLEHPELPRVTVLDSTD